MKKVPARIQKVRLRAASRRTVNGAQKWVGTAGPGAGAAPSGSPNERRPTSFGLFCMKSSTSAATTRQAMNTGMTA